jgi:hypothetical protein
MKTLFQNEHPKVSEFFTERTHFKTPQDESFCNSAFSVQPSAFSLQPFPLLIRLKPAIEIMKLTRSPKPKVWSAEFEPKTQ